MEISKDKVAILDYVLKDDEGLVIDQSSNGEFAYLAGSGGIIPGLEGALEGKKAGDELSVTVTPQDGYGEIDPAGIQEIPKDMFPEDMDIAAGMQFEAQSPAGEMMILTVKNINSDTVIADANHELAGKTLHFDVKIIEVREASTVELEHGHVHGPGGHHH
jgi:FKBP-type peptidyl-prolyl cis-trans isomerase SlyD